uniref:Uncharacterized protein n=1 Tax=Macrostomum lignano TaxID=282301 RepID=A0A1I8HFS3_9PLAT
MLFHWHQIPLALRLQLLRLLSQAPS